MNTYLPFGGATVLDTQANSLVTTSRDSKAVADAPCLMLPDFGAPVSMGTTILAAEFDGGVVLAADSRTSSGSYIVNRVSDKITKISDKIFCCRSGSAADTQAVADYVRLYLSQHSAELNEEPSVAACAGLFHQMCYSNRDYLMAGMIVAGWDKRGGGSVYSIPLGGAKIRQPLAVGGSGSTYILGYLDANFREKMSKQQCQEFARTAVGLAMSLDGSSGGVIRMVTITADGAERTVFHGDALPSFYEGSADKAKWAQ